MLPHLVSSAHLWPGVAFRFCTALQERVCGDENTRFGFRDIETLLKATEREMEVVNTAETATEDLLADVTSLVYSLCARLSGQRSAQRKTEQLVQEWEAPDAAG
jgi:predicted site-specific integrase-resolvase